MAVAVVEDTLLNKPIATPELLLHELQLGEQLSECVHQARRSDFALMLAMLSDDVREQSQFILPKTLSTDDTSEDNTKKNTQTLRAFFELPEEAPLALKNIEQINQYNQAQLIVDNKLASLHLLNAIAPKPLTFRDNKKHIASHILTNTSLVCQKKQAQSDVNQVINKPLNMQVESWLKAIDTSIVKSSLFDTIAA